MSVFARMNTKADATRGAWLHLAHPQLGHPLHTGTGADDHGRVADEVSAVKSELKVRGVESDVVRSRLKAMQAKKTTDAEDDKFVASLVIEARGISNGERDISAAEADILWLFERSVSFKSQVMAFALDPANFFGAATA